MEFTHFIQLSAIGLQARIPTHITGFPCVGKTEFSNSLEAGFSRAGVHGKVFILFGSIREPHEFRWLSSVDPHEYNVDSAAA